METEEIRDTIISGFVSIFGSLRANFLLTTAFKQCEDIEKKHDCIREVLDKVKDNTEQFILRLESIINLHTNILKKKPSVIERINSILYLMKVVYDPKTEKIISADSFTSVLLDRKEKFIQIDENFIPDTFYKKLIEEINTCYYGEAYTATMILIRKLFENQLIDILRKKYGIGENRDLYWYEKYNQFQSFFVLIRNFKRKRDELKHYSNRLDDDFFKFLDETIRMQGNESAHSIEEHVCRNELLELQVKINFYTNLLFSVMKKI